MESRRHPRTQCFQVSHGHDLTPVWVFRRSSEESILGLVVDFSESGLQALVGKDEPLDAELYTLLIDGMDGGPNGLPAPGPGFLVRHRWIGEPMGLYARCGFQFEDPGTARSCYRYLSEEVGRGTTWIRCELQESEDPDESR
jgi:hypothetical protein